MTHAKLQTLYGLKFHPFRPDVPLEALYVTPAVDSFLRRVELGIADGGFALITGDPGTGKSVALRLLAQRLRGLRDLAVGTLEHPQSRTSDFYRELGDLFNVPLATNNRFAGFKALRARWSDHIAQTLMRPVLIIDEAQETLSAVFNELRTLASKELDSRQLLSVVLAGDARLPERLRNPDLLPLGSRIRRRSGRRCSLISPLRPRSLVREARDLATWCSVCRAHSSGRSRAAAAARCWGFLLCSANRP
jgi:general secretion pathway protein A